MDLAFHLDFGTVLVSAGVLIIPASSRWLWHKFEQKLNENKEESKAQAAAVAAALINEASAIKQEAAVFQETMQSTLKRIETQTTETKEQTLKTNGRVTELEKQHEFLRGVLVGKGETQ